MYDSPLTRPSAGGSSAHLLDANGDVLNPASPPPNNEGQAALPFKRASAQIKAANERFRAVVKEHPFLALGAALGGGYLFGLSIRRLTR